MSSDTYDDAGQPHAEPMSMTAPPAELTDTSFREIQQVGLVGRVHACNACSNNSDKRAHCKQAHAAHKCTCTEVGDDTPGPASDRVVTCRGRANPNAALQNTHGQKLARTRATGVVGYHTDLAHCIITQVFGTAAAGTVGSPAEKAYGRERNQCHRHQNLPK